VVPTTVGAIMNSLNGHYGSRRECDPFLNYVKWAKRCSLIVSSSCTCQNVGGEFHCRACSAE
jgi:hypothetical protein